jgi:hypothetical protein
MDEDSVHSLTPQSPDTNLIDLLAAILTGVFADGFWIILRFVGMQDPGHEDPLPYYGVRGLLIRVGSLVFAVLIVALWKHPLRVKWGWILVALLGTGIIAGICVAVVENSVSLRDMMLMGLIVAMMVGIPALILMGAAHYIGVLVWLRLHKST